jgi:hypothetical protein
MDGIVAEASRRRNAASSGARQTRGVTGVERLAIYSPHYFTNNPEQVIARP